MKELKEESRFPENLSISGFYTPFQQNDQPHFVQMPYVDDFWVAIFSDLDKLDDGCRRLGIKDYKIKLILDGRDFIDSIKENNIRIMLDPYVVLEKNKTRWTEVS